VRPSLRQRRNPGTDTNLPAFPTFAPRRPVLRSVPVMAGWTATPWGAFAEFPVGGGPGAKVRPTRARRPRLKLQEYLKCAFHSRLHSVWQPWRWRTGAVTRSPRSRLRCRNRRSSRHNRRRFLPRTHRSSRLGRRNIDAHLLGLCAGVRAERSVSLTSCSNSSQRRVASRIAGSSRNSRLGLPTRLPKGFPDMCASSGAVAAHTATVAPVAGVLRNLRI
jgi:hypothetical protein